MPRLCVPLLLATLLPFAARAQDPIRTTSIPPVTAERLAEILAGDEPTDLAELQALQDHVQQLIQRVLPATVSLPGASGVIVKRDDKHWLLCAAHVTLTAGKLIRIRTEDDQQLRGTSLGANHQDDVSLVRIETEGEHPTVEIGKSSTLKRGQWVLMLGHPSGHKEGRAAPARLGRVLRVPESGYLVTDCTMQGGDSGGPLFDMQGRVVGINSRISGNLAHNMHAPVDALTAQWQELVDGKITEKRTRNRGRTRAGFGVELQFGEGCPVFGNVEKGSLAEKAGLRAGDRLLEIDEVEVQSRRSVFRALRNLRVGDKVAIVVLREDRGVELTLELVERQSR